MTIIYDNIVFSLQKYGGISVVWSSLLSRVIGGKSCDVHCLEYDGAESNISRASLDLPSSIVCKVKSICLKVTRYFNPSKSTIRKANTDNGAPFVFHSSYYRTCDCKNAVNVTTVHDFAYEYFVKNPIVRYMHCHQKYNAIRKASKVVCISQNTKRDLLKFLPDVDPAKVVVIYNGVDRKFHRIEGSECKGYVLYVGNRDRYKNFLALVEPLAKLRCRLLIAGKPLTERELDEMKYAHLAFEYCGMVSDAMLNKLYNEALCLMYTSSYEGFGLPVLEAQMAGCPVIAYNASSIPEVIGDRRLLIDDFSSESIGRCLDLVKDAGAREKIIRDGLANANKYSWDKMADEYMQLYDALLNSNIR